MNTYYAAKSPSKQALIINKQQSDTNNGYDCISQPKRKRGQKNKENVKAYMNGNKLDKAAYLVCILRRDPPSFSAYPASTWVAYRMLL